MGVFSWFRRREAGARAAGATDGGAVAVLDPQGRTEQERTEDAAQEPLPGVPAARTAPEAGELEGPQGGAARGEGARGADPAVGPVEEDLGATGFRTVGADVAELLAAAVAAVAEAAQAAQPAQDSHRESRPERPDTGDEAMGLMDNLKGKAEELKEKAGQLAGQHNEKIDDLVDKAGEALDKATKGKYSDKIATGTEKAKGAVDGFAEKPGDPGQTGQAPGQTDRTGQGDGSTGDAGSGDRPS
ncbi:hypothetical protein GCM10009665_62120 [Kitasatospora nipponensis]|uniref:Antitoxin protein of toxin-antitoxin system n=1 Tax=Kitasatospora nipponensis TaxID=258049 RepID=A0ABN1WT40_9ACTN